jgi:hypothetical protein
MAQITDIILYPDSNYLHYNDTDIRRRYFHGYHVQPSPRHPLPLCGMKPTVLGKYRLDQPLQGTATVDRGHVPSASAGCRARLDGRPRRLGATQGGRDTW